ncbi:MAG: pyridoxamine 5'-phosphate oxidase, partial [Bacteroidota bacterium]
MFTTQDEGKLFSRPIAVSEVEDNGNIWFFTDI